MKKLLILYPHFPPSNLAGVHRPRLFAQHLPAFGWEPTILTVHEDFYEEEPDYNLVKLLPANLRVEKVKAFKVGGKVRLIGDIGLRAFFQLYKRAKQLIKIERFDFLYIPIPSFYCALLGRLLHSSTKIKYGIDYIDPWVHQFPGADKRFSRHWWSAKLSGILEPIAVKKASLITGVAEGYFEAVLERNPFLRKNVVYGAMPYGGEASDHDKLATLALKPYLFLPKKNVLQLVYAGALLPKAYSPLERIFKAIAKHPVALANVEFHFIGTGSRANDPQSHTVKPLAEKYGLYNNFIFEYPKRISYLDVLVHLNCASGVFVLGSTEPHYTPSKIYQGVLTGKFILAVLHNQSTAVKVLESSGAGIVLTFEGADDLEKIEQNFISVINAWKVLQKDFQAAGVNRAAIDEYSASSITQSFVRLLNKTQ